MPGIIDYQELESGSVLNMIDSDASDLLGELSEKQRRRRIWPIIGTASAIALIWGAISANEQLVIAGLIGAVIATPLLSLWDRRRKTTVLLYDLEPEAEEAYRRLYEEFEGLKECSRLWHIEGRGTVEDSKYHAGATHGVKRNRVTPSEKAPPGIRTNVPVLTLSAGKQQLCFFPDRLLIFEKTNVGAVPFREVTVAVDATKFIEDEPVPKDAKVVGRTWRYVNKKGGPDKRFKSNPELPVALYEEIAFTSASGLNEHFQLSKLGVAGGFKNAISGMRVG